MQSPARSDESGNAQTHSESTNVDLFIVMGQAVRQTISVLRHKHPQAKIFVYTKLRSNSDAPKGFPVFDRLEVLREAIIQWAGLPFVTMSLIRTDDSFTDAERDEAMSDCSAAMDTRTTSWNTIGQFGNSWIRNATSNLPLIASEHIQSEYQDLFKGKDCIIVGAGPSLNKYIGRLKKIHDNNAAIIVVAARAAHTLQAHGVYAHYVLSVESQDVSDHFAGLDLSRSVVGLAAVSPPSVVRATANAKQRFWFSANGSMDHWCFDALGETGTLRTGGSVVTAAFSFAARLNASRVILMGCDFAYDGESVYAGNADAKIIKQDDGTYSYINPVTGNTHQVPVLEVAGYGGTVLTHKSWDQCRKWFEVVFKTMPEHVKAINASGSGSLYKNCENTTIDALSFESQSISPEHTTKPDRQRNARRERVKSLDRFKSSVLNDLRRIDKCLSEFDGVNGQMELLAAISKSAQVTLKLGWLFAPCTRFLLGYLTEAHRAQSTKDYTDAVKRYSTLSRQSLAATKVILEGLS